MAGLLNQPKSITAQGFYTVWEILSGHSALRYEIEMSATPGLSRECRFGKSGKLFLPFVTMTPAALSFALSI